MIDVSPVHDGENTVMINTKCSTPGDINTTAGDHHLVLALLDAYRKDTAGKDLSSIAQTKVIDTPVKKAVSLFDINTMSLANAALAYERLGFSLVPLLPKSKKTYSKSWSQKDFQRDPKYWSTPGYMDNNIGLSLGRNNILSVDIDSTDGFYKAMELIRDKLLSETGVKNPFWEVTTAGIKSGKAGKAKLIFRRPEGDYPFLDVKLQLDWEKDKQGIHILELRGGFKFQDVVPPSIHPDTLTTYQWVNSDSFEVAPPDLIYLWNHWVDFYFYLKEKDPNYVTKPKVMVPRKPATPRPCSSTQSQVKKEYHGMNVIQKYNETHSIDQILREHGYEWGEGSGWSRMIRPNSTSHIPGVVVDVLQNKCKSYHDDPLGDGWKHDPFDVLTLLDYNGDTKAAYQAALRELGLDTASQIMSKMGKIARQA